MDTTVVDDIFHTTYSYDSTHSSESMEPTFHTDSMEGACSLAVEILEAPEIDSLPSSDTSKQELIALCEQACGRSCPSAAEQDRASVFLNKK